MKNISRRLIFTIIGIALLSYFTGGISYGGSVTTLVTASVVYVIIDWLLKPLIQIVLLPINLMTFGLLSWLVGVIVLWLTIQLVDGLTVSAFSFGPINLWLVVIPRLMMSGGWSLVTMSIMLTTIRKLLFKLV